MCESESACESEVKVLVAQSCLTLRNLVDCSSPGSFVYGILQARILENTHTHTHTHTNIHTHIGLHEPRENYRTARWLT